MNSSPSTLRKRRSRIVAGMKKDINSENCKLNSRILNRVFDSDLGIPSDSTAVTSIYLENEVIKIRYLTCEVESFRDYPLSSKLLNIYRVNGFKRSQIGNITMLARKCLLLPTPKHGGSRISFICIPFTKPL